MTDGSRKQNGTVNGKILTENMGDELPIMTPTSSDDKSGLYIPDDPRKPKGMLSQDYLDNSRNFK
nr:hypothetical protein [Mucilaginibacter sp. E4BP6]